MAASIHHQPASRISKSERGGAIIVGLLEMISWQFLRRLDDLSQFLRDLDDLSQIRRSLDDLWRYQEEREVEEYLEHFENRKRYRSIDAGKMLGDWISAEW